MLEETPLGGSGGHLGAAARPDVTEMHVLQRVGKFSFKGLQRLGVIGRLGETGWDLRWSNCLMITPDGKGKEKKEPLVWNGVLGQVPPHLSEPEILFFFSFFTSVAGFLFASLCSAPP